MMLGCEGDARRAGEVCEDDDECPAGLECLIEACRSGSVTRHCSVECDTINDCAGFAEPSCEVVSGLTSSCIEKGRNPCEP
jgi:hypothetical protein